MTEEKREFGKEYPPAGEEALIQKIMEISQASMKLRGENHPPTPRDQHPKSHGYVHGEFTVLESFEGLPHGFNEQDLKVGVFAYPKTYPVWIRFSNGGSDRDPTTGDYLSDTVGDVRGMAIKLMDVDGEMAIEDQLHQREQDFILMNNPHFFIKDVQDYIHFFSVMRAIKTGKIILQKDKQPEFKEDEIPQEELAKLKQSFGAISYALKLVGPIKAKSTPSLLEVLYWSATPYKLGDKAIKFSVTPHSGNGNFKLENATDQSHYLRESMTTHLDDNDAYFDFNVQFQTDADKMPVEDPTVEWDEQESPYIKVAVLKIPKQDFNTDERKQQDEKQSFSPWHSLIEHQPLGGVNRARKIYAELAKMRNEINAKNG
jgi:catalase